MKNKICVYAPATIANLNVGFDILGLSLCNIGDKVEVSWNNMNINRITEIINGDKLPTDPNKNSCGAVIIKMQEISGDRKGVDIRIKKGFVSGSGLGSSSASSAAAAVAFNELLGNKYTAEELIHFATEGERVACGTAHFDNVAPAILGGLVLIHQQKMIKLPLPEGIHAVLFYPEITINTAGSRSILKKDFSLSLISQQVAHMGAFVASLYQNNIDLMSKSMRDIIIEPFRKTLIPFFDEMKLAAMQQKALAFGISGSGPSMFALASSKNDSEKILAAMQAVYKDSGIDSQYYIEKLSNQSETRITQYNG